MYKFGKTSQSRLDTCHNDLQIILNEVIKFYDVSVLEGLRSTKKQQQYFTDGKSKLDGINKLSKHQDHGDGISYAVDIMPYLKGENAFSDSKADINRFYYLAGIMLGVSNMLLAQGKISHRLRWGGDWDSDHSFKDQTFNDLPHFELVKV